MKSGHTRKPWVPLLGGLALAACGGGGDAPGASPVDDVPQQIACADFPDKFQSGEDAVIITAATEVAAAGSTPAYCDLTGC